MLMLPTWAPSLLMPLLVDWILQQAHCQPLARQERSCVSWAPARSAYSRNETEGVVLHSNVHLHSNVLSMLYPFVCSALAMIHGPLPGVCWLRIIKAE